MKEEIEEDDELFIVDENGETQLSGYTGPDFENNLRVPLLEILKYPYLLLHKRIGEYPKVYPCKNPVLPLMQKVKIVVSHCINIVVIFSKC